MPRPSRAFGGACPPVPSASGDKSRVVRAVQRLGSFPTIYSALRTTMGGDRYWRHLVEDVAAVRPGMRILDVGCGPAGVTDHLPDVVYVGVDHNARYIRQARLRCDPAYTFVHAEATEVGALDGQFDVVWAMGVLHHLSDRDARAMIEGARQRLAPGGMLLTADVVAVPEASRSARWMLERDRGDHVRPPAGYAALLGTAFEDVRLTVEHDLLRVPFTGAGYPLLVACAAQARRVVDPVRVERQDDAPQPVRAPSYAG